MPSFLELQTLVRTQKQHDKVITHIVELLDSQFLPVGGGDPLSVMLDDDGARIPDSVFEDVIHNLLDPERERARREVERILSSNVSLTPAPLPTEKP